MLGRLAKNGSMKWRHPFASMSLHAGKSFPVELFQRYFKELKPLQINICHQINDEQGIKQNRYKKNADFNESIPLPCLSLPWLWVANPDVCISQKCFLSVLVCLGVTEKHCVTLVMTVASITTMHQNWNHSEKSSLDEAGFSCWSLQAILQTTFVIVFQFFSQ